jgi:hypothetical protein
VENAIGLDPKAEYHAYDFWSDTYLGKRSGTDHIQQKLKPNCCAMISLRKAMPYPQVISTDRHLLQGWVELADVSWDPTTGVLSGTAKVIGGEPFKIVVAGNGHKVLETAVTGVGAELNACSEADLNCLTLTSADTAEVNWSLEYE